MATPTANVSSGKQQQQQPGQAQVPFTPTASSPPAHKSVRSPVSQMKRSRADTLRGMEHSASQQGGSTPRSGQPGSSPSFLGTPGASYGSTGATGLGLSINTPNGGMATPGAAAMQRVGSNSFGLSSLGADPSILNADREALTRDRIRIMLGMLADHWGQVSRVGVERVARRIRLECLWESGENEERGVLAMAGDGNSFFLQISWIKHAVEDVQLNFPTAEGSGRLKEPEEEKNGSLILKNDLKGWDNDQDRGFYVDLIKFAHNMQYLTEIDRLSKSGIRCFEAIDGVQKSLREVEVWWKKRPGVKDDLEVLNLGTGWSRMHGNGKVGARLDYWLHRWFVRRRTAVPSRITPSITPDPDLYGLRISVAPLSPGSFVTPIRNTTDWFDFLDALPIEESGDSAPSFPPLQLHRKEPQSTYLPSTENQPDENGNLVPGTLPSISFKAIFDPPLPLSYLASTNLFGQSNELALSYASVLFPDLNAEVLPMEVPLTFTRERELRDGTTLTTVKFRLTNANSLPVLLLREMPFSHPHELLTWLPTLRQWAWLHALLTKTLGEADLLSKRPDSSTESKKRKTKRKKLSAKEVRAIIKAGGTWVPASDTEDTDDEEEEESLTAGMVDISLELLDTKLDTTALDMTAMSALQSPIVLRLTIPRLDAVEPIMAQFTLSPGPTLVASGISDGDDFARRLAKLLLVTADLALLVLWAREQAPKYVRPEGQAGMQAENGAGRRGKNGEQRDAEMKDL